MTLNTDVYATVRSLGRYHALTQPGSYYAQACTISVNANTYAHINRLTRTHNHLFCYSRGTRSSLSGLSFH